MGPPRTDDGVAAGFRCPACARDYPELGGIPRFAGEAYVASFGRQWNRYDVARDDEDEAVFAVKTGRPPSRATSTACSCSTPAAAGAGMLASRGVTGRESSGST